MASNILPVTDRVKKKSLNMGEITALIRQLRESSDPEKRLAADALAAMQRHAFNAHDLIFLDP